MSQVKRTRYLFFTIDDTPLLDIALLLRGQVSLELAKQVYAISLLQGREYPITLNELRILFEIPSDEWISTSEAIERYHTDLEMLLRFARQGLLLSDEGDELFIELRNRDEKLSLTRWDVYAALYHLMTKWHDVNVDAHFPIDQQEWEEYNARIDEVYKEFIGRL